MGAAASLIAIFVAVLAIPLSAGEAIGLAEAEVTSWIAAVYGVAGVLNLVLIVRYRQPLLLTGNVFILIFVSRLGTDLVWSELVGASMVAGAAVLALGPSGLTARVARLLPPPVIFGLLAGAVLPFVVAMFSAMGGAPLLIGSSVVAFLVARAVVEPRVPAVLVAMVVAVAVAVGQGAFGSVPADPSLPPLDVVVPTFSFRAIATTTPVLVVLITLQANVPSLVFLREQGYRPPERTLDVVSGAGTLFGSLLGPMGVSLSLPAAAIVAGPGAGPLGTRHRAAVIASVASVVIALLAGFAADLQRVVPDELLAAVVGLAVVGVLATAIRSAVGGPLLLGPLFAFVIALSELELFGLGAFFWALVGGSAISLTLERDALAATRPAGTAEGPAVGDHGTDPRP